MPTFRLSYKCSLALNIAKIRLYYETAKSFDIFLAFKLINQYRIVLDKFLQLKYRIMLCCALCLIFQIVHILLAYLLYQIFAVHLNVPLIENIARHTLRIAIQFVKACREVSPAHIMPILNIFPIVNPTT